jgi:proline iminopeptidase
MEIKDKIVAEDLFYQKSKPFRTSYVDVGDGHQICCQELGNPKGVPVLLVHGGPGCAVAPGEPFTRLHNPAYFRIILVDQRGCGQSKPSFLDDPRGALRHNHPDKLVSDFEQIRRHLKIDRWHLFGYSWGSCLSAYYATRHPEVIRSITIGGIWMHTSEEIDWYINRMGLFFPEDNAKLLQILGPKVKPHDRLGYLYKAITGPDQKLALRVAKAQGDFEFRAIHFEVPLAAKDKKQSKAERLAEERKWTATGALEVYFMKEHPFQNGWYETKAAQTALKKIKDIRMIQGRYDVVCPPVTAFRFQQAHPHAQLVMVQFAGHMTKELQMSTALLVANRRLEK